MESKRRFAGGTIEKFKSVLLSVGIHTKVVEEENYKEYWYSNRIEIDGIETGRYEWQRQ